MATKVGSVGEIVALINSNRYNQGQLALDALNIFRTFHKGEVDIYDGTNPFVHSLSFTAACAAANANQMDSIHRALYPVLARTDEDLNRHISGSENLGRWGSPAVSKINFLTDLPSILSKAILVDGVKRLVIPEETVIEVGGYTFGLYYPVNINVMGNNNIKVLLNTDEMNPLYTPSSNEIEYVYREQQYDPEGDGSVLPPEQRRTLLDITLPVYQFTRNNYQEVLNASVGFTREYPVKDKLMSVRVWTGNDAVGWRELDIAYSNEVYDNLSDTPVAVVALKSETVKVSIPQIFFSRALMGSKLKVAVYATKGDVQFSLKDFDTTEFKVSFVDTNPKTKQLSSPLRNVAVSAAYSKALVNGGGNGMTFEETRAMVIYNNTTVSEPVTQIQLEEKLNSLGYDLVVFKDYLTKKLYLASRPLAEITIDNSKVIPSGGFGVVSSTIEQLASLDTVEDNLSQITVKPETLYLLEDGVIRILNDAERTRIEKLPATTLVATLNQGNYLYSPFYYVLDISNENYFDYRAYHLNSPEFLSKFFVDALESTPISCSTRSINFYKVANGWELLVETNASSELLSSEDDDVVQAQLAFVGINDVNYSGLNGEFVGRTDEGNFIFKFLLETEYQINDKSQVSLTNFRLQINDQLPKATELTNNFRLSYTTNLIPDTSLNGNIVQIISPVGYNCFNVETLRVKLGEELSSMYSRSRAMATSRVVKRYPENIMSYYEKDVYELEENGAYKLVENPDYPATSDDPYNLNKLHSAGDPVLNPISGEHEILHPKDSPVIVNGEVIYEGGRELGYYLDIFFLDSKFRFATEKTSTTFATSIPNSIVDFIRNDVDVYRKSLLDGTDLKLYPKRNVGSVSVRSSEGQVLNINGQQRLNFRVYLPDEVYDDSKATKLINQTIRSIAATKLSKVNVNIDDILETIRAEIGSDIVSIAMDKLGDNQTLDRFTLVNAHESINLAVDMEVQSDFTIKLVNGVTIAPYRANTQADK